MAGLRLLRRAAPRVVAATAAAFVLWVPTGARAASPSPVPGVSARGGGDQIVLVGRVVVPRGEVVDEVVVFSGRAQIGGVVLGDVVVVDGPVSIAGQVSGSVVAMNGPVSLAATAQVGGQVLGHGVVSAEPGAQVAGGIKQHAVFSLRGPLEALGAFVTRLSVAVSTLLLGLAMLFVAPRGIERVTAVGRATPWASAAWGLACAIALPVLAVAAMATILGLPLGLTLLLALAFVFMIGYAATVHVVGRLVAGERRGRLLAFLAGWVIALALGVIPYVGAVAWVGGATFGLGALAVATRMARHRDHRRGGRHRRGATRPTARTEADEPSTGLERV